MRAETMDTNGRDRLGTVWRRKREIQGRVEEGRAGEMEHQAGRKEC